MALRCFRRLSCRSIFSAPSSSRYIQPVRCLVACKVTQTPRRACLRTYLFANENAPQHLIVRQLASYPPHTVIKLPNLSPTMETGTVVSWAKNEGDEVSEGDLLAEIETDKATMSFDASENGYLAKILAPQGTKDIPVGTPLCVLVEDASSVAAFSGFTAADAGAAPSKPAAPPAEKPAAPPAEKPVKAAAPPPAPASQTAAPPTQPAPMPIPAAPLAADGQRVFVTPLARRMATEQGIDLSQLAASKTGTGLYGAIRSTDLSGAKPGLTAPGVGADAATGFLDVALTNMRAVIAKRLLESKQTIPHYYLTVDIELDKVLTLRTELNATLAKLVGKDEKPAKITVNDVLVKAAAICCLKVPECNSAWHGDFIRQYTSADINVAIATPAGLITPIVFGAERKGLLQINTEIRALSVKAKENKLQPQEFQGGTFTISNLGMFGISSFSAIINPPQACILAVGNTQKRIVVDKESALGYREAQLLSVTLCCDHRVVDGAVGAKWLAEFKKALEQPGLMLM